MFDDLAGGLHDARDALLLHGLYPDTVLQLPYLPVRAEEDDFAFIPIGALGWRRRDDGVAEFGALVVKRPHLEAEIVPQRAQVDVLPDHLVLLAEGTLGHGEVVGAGEKAALLLKDVLLAPQVLGRDVVAATLAVGTEEVLEGCGDEAVDAPLVAAAAGGCHLASDCGRHPAHPAVVYPD